MRAGSPFYSSRARRRAPARSVLGKVALAGGALALLALLIGLAYAGPRAALAEGTIVAGVDVGGKSRAEAVALLEQRFEAVESTPVTFTAGGASVRLSADDMLVRPDFKAAVRVASEAGSGFGPVRGFRRLRTRIFGATVVPPVMASDAALEHAVEQLAARVDEPAVSAALARRGLRLEIVSEQTGKGLDRTGAVETIARALGSISGRARTVGLPVMTTEPEVGSVMLAPALEEAQTALSAPVRLRIGPTRFLLSRYRLAKILSLPRGGRTQLELSGPAATAYFVELSRSVGRPPVGARFVTDGEAVRIAPSRPGVALDQEAAAKAVLRAAVSPAYRVATLRVERAQPTRTTAVAQAMGITTRLSTYKTWNSGTDDRIMNLRLAVTALDGTLLAPGATFSLNGVVGERTLERGFRPAPVILGTEFAEEVGGGTSQVATTVFNAAWESGLRITERNPHALYISRYQLGRDATVYWPSLDLKFVNDTRTWVLVRGFAEPDGIRVSVYGGEKRRVDSSAGTMKITGAPPVKRVKDPKLLVGKRVVEEKGSSPRATSVTRTIYRQDGTLLRAETWNTAYKGEYRVIRVGTKPKPEPKTPAQPAGSGATATKPKPSVSP